MKIQTIFTTNGITLFVVNTYGSAKIGSQQLNDVSMGKEKINLIRDLYENNKEYDMEPFFKTWIMMRNTRIPASHPEIYQNLLNRLRTVLNGTDME